MERVVLASGVLEPLAPALLLLLLCASDKRTDRSSLLPILFLRDPGDPDALQLVDDQAGVLLEEL